MMKWKQVLGLNRQQYSLPIKIFLVMMIGNIGPILLLTLYEFIRFHEVLFGKGDILTIVYACSILLSLAFVGYIVCEITQPMKALIANIEAYRLKKIKPILRGITKVEEFNYLFTEYEKLIKEIEHYELELINKTTLAAIGSTTAMVAHDVRRPLNSITMFLRALPNIKNDPAQIEKLTIEIEKSIANTNTMINNILECSHTIRETDLQEHSLQSIILLSLNEVFRNKPEVAIKVDYVFNHENRAVYVDGLRLKRVFDNIITNSLEAMTANEDGKICGNLFFKTELLGEDDQDYVRVVVVDDGSGIPPEILSKIYEPFFSYGKKYGDGLGLAISSNVISMLKGKMEIKNRVNACGTEVILKLVAGKSFIASNDLELIFDSRSSNLNEEKSKESALLPLSVNGEYCEKLAILIADDEQIVRDSLLYLLESLLGEQSRCAIVDVSSGEEALDLLNKRFFTHIITDIDFGKNHINGYELVKIILDKYKDSYVIIHSNKRNNDLDRSLVINYRERFLGFVQKPIQTSELLKFIVHNSLQKQVVDTIAEKIPYGKKILVLNDDVAFNYSIKINLRSYGIEAHTAANVGDAMRCFTENKIDCIVADINLGNSQEDGYDFLEKVRFINKKIPFVMVSGYDKGKVWARAESLGATSYMQVPFKIEDLVGLLSTYA